MPSYQVNQAAVDHARELIDRGRYDADTDWSDAAPSAAEENQAIEDQGWEGFSAWHLAVDPEASEETKKRFAFPYGDFSTVNRAALIHAKQRASQNDHDAIEQAADELLTRLDGQRS
jgi:hypothetical protein